MLKSFIILLATLVILGCASKPQEKGFSGTGKFDAAEAAKTRVSLGLTYLQNGNFSQAKFNLDKALEFAPKSGQANYAMAFYYEQVDEKDRAEEYFGNALNYSNNAPDILNSYGAFLCKQGRYDKAKENFLKAVDDKRYVSTAETYENLALCSQSQGKLDEATQFFNTALNHQPTRASTLLYLTEIYVDEGQWENAKRSLFKYERNASVNANSLWLSYQIAQGQNDVEAAQNYAALLLRLFPEHEFTTLANQSDAIWQPSKKVTQKVKQREQTPDEPKGKAKLVISPNDTPKTLKELANSGVVGSAPNAQLKTKKSQQAASIDKAESERDLTEKLLAESLDSKPLETADSGAAMKTVTKQKSKAASATQNVSGSEGIQTDLSADSNHYHVVKPKENLFQISRKYNVKMSKLIEWNNLSDASSIQIGSRLWIRDPNSNE